jgi:hypothetical protein
MFKPEFLNSLQQPFGDNPSLADLTNRNFKTWFHWQCNYLSGFNVPKKINNSILENNWPRKDVDVEDDPYEAPIFTYGKKWTN